MTRMPVSSPETSHKVMTIVFGALLFGQIIFLGVVLFLHAQGFERNEESLEVFQYVGIAGSLAGPSASHVLHRALVKAAIAEIDASVRLMKYSAAYLVRVAILEGINLINLVFYLVTGHAIFLGLFAVILALFVLARPNRDSFLSALQPSQTTPIA